MKKRNSIFSLPFWKSLLFVQNKYHQHGVLLHTLRVVWEVLKAGEFQMLPAAFLHDIGKPFVAYVKDEEDKEYNEYSFTDHEELSYQIIKNWPFLSQYTKDLVRYHYLIRDMQKSKKEDLPRYAKKVEIWEKLDDEFKKDLELFLKFDDLGKGKRRR
ncbi:MAG: HD domain-containing protein [Epsilonproteobacteria bacterium]|nr:HD domain-containing protein [Campylobacterota bacterium]